MMSDATRCRKFACCKLIKTGSIKPKNNFVGFGPRTALLFYNCSLTLLAFFQSVVDAVRDTNFTLNNLDAYTNYSIRIRSRPKKGGRSYSDFVTTSCFTPAQKPGGGPGLVTGAYEELGNGGQRRVTLYWMGLPKHLRNGPDFRYQLTVRTLQNGRFIEGPNNIRHTEFANFVLSAPSSETYEVEIKTTNQKGDGLAERTIIPAVRDQPCRWNEYWIFFLR